MSLTIGKRITILEEIPNNNSTIKTYKGKIEPIIKEIKYKNKEELFTIRDRIERIKEITKVYDIIEEKGKFYVVMENNAPISKIDKLLLNENEIEKEGILRDQGSPISKTEISKLLKMEKAMCKIKFRKYTKEGINPGKGTGFFCKLDNLDYLPNFPIKYALFTNHHVLDEDNIKMGKINIELFNGEEKQIILDEERIVFTNKEIDYT